MAKYRYKNVSLNTVVIIGVGQVAPNDTIASDVELTNSDLKLIDDPTTSQVKPADTTTMPNQKGTPATQITDEGGTN